MEYLSTRNHKLRENFTTVLLQGLSSDGGLFLPSSWPKLNINDFRENSYDELAFKIISCYTNNEIPQNDLKLIIKDTYCNFNHPKIAPLVKVDNNKYILELFYGPTLAFKDYPLQFLGNLFSYVMQEKNKKITILGATSGDTGSAAINAFKGKNNINVFILHPFNKVSEVQRKQMTTVEEKNIFNIAIKGNFDDCQKIVKDLFLNKDIQKKTSLTAVNSINWARIMAQTIYYFWAFLQMKEDFVSFIVPSGNFGNVFSARVAQLMGLPIKKLHIATNSNDILHRIISSGEMKITKVQQTYSPSMDIQVSSNFERQLFEIFDKDSDLVKTIMTHLKINQSYKFENKILENLQKIYSSKSTSDKLTLQIINTFKKKYNYLADPHTATGLSILLDCKDNHPLVSLSCAHPAKFSNAIIEATGTEPILPLELKNIFDKKEKMSILENDTEAVKNFILNII